MTDRVCISVLGFKWLNDTAGRTIMAPHEYTYCQVLLFMADGAREAHGCTRRQLADAVCAMDRPFLSRFKRESAAVIQEMVDAGLLEEEFDGLACVANLAL